MHTVAFSKLLPWFEPRYYFENATSCSKRTLKTTVATQLKWHCAYSICPNLWNGRSNVGAYLKNSNIKGWSLRCLHILKYGNKSFVSLHFLISFHILFFTNFLYPYFFSLIITLSLSVYSYIIWSPNKNLFWSTSRRTTIMTPFKNYNNM